MSASERLAGAGRAVGILAGLAGPAVLLAVVVGNPLPAWPVDWSSVGAQIQAGLVPSSVWVNILAVIAWVVWGWLVWAVTVETIALLRRRPSRASTPDLVRRLAHVLVTAMFAVASPTGQPVTHAAPVAAVATQDVSTGADTVQAEVTAGEGRLVTVEVDDSWAGLAEMVLRDAGLGGQLRDANVGRRMPDGTTISGGTVFVEPGWELLIPAAIEPAAPVTLTTAAEGQAGNAAGVPDAGTVEVEPGDHFWKIAHDTLDDSWGRAPSEEETADYWHEVVDANMDRLDPPGDPDLIYPGQQFVLPAVPADPAVRSSDGPAATADVPAEQTAVTADTAAVDSEGGSQDTDAESDREQPASASDASRPAASSNQGDVEPSGQWLRGLQEGLGEPGGEVVAAEEDRTVWGAPLGLRAGLAAAMVSAAGVAALLRRRRRAASQQRPEGLRLPTLAPDVEEELSRIDVAAAEDGPLDSLAALLESLPPSMFPPLVALGDDGMVRLLWEGEPPADPSAPWTLHADGQGRPVGWQATIGQPGHPRSVGLPLLVTLGRTETGVTLLANVGAMRHLRVAGPAGPVRGRLRAAALEVATSRMCGLVEVTVVGDDLLADVDGVTLANDLSVPLAAASAERDRDIIVPDRIPRLLVCHDAAAVFDVDDDLAGLVGLVATTADRSESPTDGDDVWTGWTVELSADTSQDAVLRLQDGGEVSLTLPELDPELVEQELSRLTAPPVPADPIAEHPAGTALPDDRVVVSMGPAPVEPAWCEVRLLGPVEVIRDGDPVETLTQQNLELLVCLAAHGQDGLTFDQLEDRVWSGRRSKSGRSRVSTALSALRQRLGDGPDGVPLVPPRDSGDTRIRLCGHVGSDWDRAHRHLEAARDLPPAVRHRELVAALELVRGPVLDGLTLSWGTRLEQEMLAPLQDAAVAAAAALREAGEWDRAEWAIRQGLLLCDPHEPAYVEWARLETARGRPDQVARIWRLLGRQYAEDADEVAGWVVAPTDATRAAFQDLMARNG